MRHLLGISELSHDDVAALFQKAEFFSKSNPSQSKQHPFWSKTRVLTFFLENSTRTRVSFEVAARALGADVIHFETERSSLHKGETLVDTGKNIAAMGVGAVVFRSDRSGSPWVLAAHAGVPVINAGDGMHEHPTQALLDTWTLQKHWKSLNGRSILLLGDVLHSRVARSNLMLWKRMGVDVAVCGPPTYLPHHMDLRIVPTHELDQALRQVDAVYCLRVQRERAGIATIPSTEEYRRYWGLTTKRAKLLQESTLVLHPGPTNRGVEIDPEVADGAHARILEQVQAGVWIRMAVLDAVAGRAGPGWSAR